MPVDVAVADTIADGLTSDLHWPSANEANIIYCVSGAIVRFIARRNKRDSCKEMLISTDQLEPLTNDELLDYTASKFLEGINRGGLSRPTEYALMVCVRCWRTSDHIKATPELRKRFLAFTCHRNLFCQTMGRANDRDSQLIIGNYCVNGHDVKIHTVQSCFNCMAKNLVRELTNSASEENDQSSKKRKTAKLKSTVCR